MFGREPVLWMMLIRAIVVLGAAFGLQLSAEQVGAIYLTAEAVLAFVTRSKVVPMPPKKKGPPGGLTALVVCFALALPSCTKQQLQDAKSVADSAWDIARDVCFHSHAQATGISVADVVEAYDDICETREQLEPFYHLTMGATATGAKRVRAGELKEPEFE